MFLEEMTQKSGVAGFEFEIRNFIKGKLTEMGVPFHCDKIGNIIAHNKGKSSGKKIMLAAHMDEVGLMVSSIDEQGFVKFKAVGGVDTMVLAAKVVEIGDNKVKGVIGSPPIHFMSAAERGKRVPMNKMHIDIGASSKAEAEKLVSLGDPITFVSNYVEFGDNLMKAKALDDRAGCAVMLHVLSLKLDLDFYCAFTVMEEVGLRGAYAAGYAIEPDILYVLEGTVSADMPEIKDYNKVTVIGNGPVLSIMDRATIYNQKALNHVTDIAEKNGVPYQFRRVAMGGTDSGAIHTTKAGCVSVGMSLACRYIHSPICVASKNDFENIKKLMTLVLKNEMA